MLARLQRHVPFTYPSLKSITVSALMVVAPVLVTFGLLSTLRVDLQRYVPSFVGVFNDSFFYWRQIYTFSEVGFAGGYYTVDEQPAAAPFSRFYFYGPFVPMIYGTLGRLFGWYRFTGPIINAVFLMLALAAFLSVTRLGRTQRWLFLGLLITFHPLLFFLLSTMQETLHYILALFLARGFYEILTKRERTPPKLVAAMWVLIAVSGLLRITWIILFVPLFVLTARSGRAVVFAGALAAGSGVLIGGLFQYVSAPFGPGFLARFVRALFKLNDPAMEILRTHIETNLGGLTVGQPIELQQRVVVFCFGAICLAALGWKYLPVARLRNSFQNLFSDRAATTFHLFIIAVPLFITITLYDIESYRDYRVLAPHLLLSLVLLVLTARFRLVLMHIAISLIFAIPLVDAYRTAWESQFSVSEEAVTRFQNSTAGLMEYDPSATNPWCNTLFFQFGQEARLHPELLTVPPGIGLSFGRMPVMLESTSFRSKYVLLSRPTIRRYRDELHLTRLRVTDIGILHFNEDSGCQP